MKTIGLLGGMSWESSLPLFDTTSIHAQAAVAAAVEEPLRT